jgi:hypothetical protein
VSDLASLYIKVDSSGVVTASKDLDALTGKSQKAEKATDSVTSGFNKLKTVVMALAASYSALKMAQYIKEATELAAKYEMLGVTMKVAGNQAGYTGAQMEKAAQGMQKMGISLIASRENTMKMVIAQLDLKKASDLARVAQDVARVANINSSEAFTRMIQGIRSGEVEIFKTMGLMINMDKAYRDFERTNNLVKGSIDAGQRAQAVMNAVLIEGEKYAGLYAATLKTAAGQALSMQRHVENLKVAVGLAFTPVYAEIIEMLTEAIVGLNGELSGASKEAVSDWGVNFRINLISIEAEFMRLGMLLDQLGGTMTSAKMLLYGPGTALGIESSTKRFEAAADANMEYRRRYEETDKALEALALKQIALEQSLTKEGKAAAKAAQDNAEQKRMAAAAIAKAEKDKADIIARAAEKIKEAREEINKAINDNIYELQSIGKSQYEQDLIEIQKDVDAYRAAGVDKVTIAQYVASETAIATANEADRQAEETKKTAEQTADDQLKIWEKYSKDYQILLLGEIGWKRQQYMTDLDIYLAVEQAKTGATDQEIEKRKQLIIKGYEKGESEDYINKLAEAASYYKDLIGVEDTYHDKMLELIEARRVAEIKAGKDVTAANAKAIKARNDLAEEAYNTEISHIKNQWSGYADMFEGLSSLYAEDSSERARLHDISMAFQVAEQAMLLVTAVRAAVVAIATQGQGDPYTAFARVAAMAGLMAATLGKAGISFGGGGSASASAPSLPASTVLGAEAGTGSESISKAWELLEDTYDMEYRELSGIHSEMKNLNDNITGLVSSIFRTGGIDSSYVQTGTTLGSMESLYWESMNWDFGTGIFNSAYKILDTLTLGLGSWLGEGFGSIIGSIFGGGTETSATGSGISTGTASIGSLAGGGGIGAQQYADVHVHEDGGWFHSDKDYYYTTYKALDESVSRLLDKVFQNMSSTLVELTLGLGTDMNATLNYVFSGAKINLQGMDSDEINDALSEYFSALGDNAVDALFGTLLRSYQQVGEGMLETAARIIIDKEIVLDTLEMTGQAFIGTIPEIIAFSESIINMAGDLETLRKNAETYYDKFFSDEEKHLRLQGQLTGALADLNFALPDTRDGYRTLVEGLNLATTAGQEAYVSLLAWAEGADEYYSIVENAADATASLVDELKSLYMTITDWLDSLSTSDLAPVSSEAAWTNKYATMLAEATAPGAESATVTDYLNYATQFLEYQKSFGTSASYQSIYDAVVADVRALQFQTAATLGSYATGTDYVPQTGPYTLHQGEMVIPADRTVKFDTDSLGKAIAKYILQSDGGSNGELTVNVPVSIDGREIGNVVAKQIPRNPDLQKSIRRLN